MVTNLNLIELIYKQNKNYHLSLGTSTRINPYLITSTCWARGLSSASVRTSSQVHVCWGLSPASIWYVITYMYKMYTQ